LADEAALVPVMIGLTRLHLWRADRPTLEELVREEESLAERVPDPLLLVQLHTQLAWVDLFRGKHVGVAHHRQYVGTHYESQAHQLFLYSFTGDPLSVALGASGMSLGLTGWIERGWNDAAQGLVRAEKLQSPIISTFAVLYAGMVKHLRGEYDEAWRLAQETIALGYEYELPLLVILGGLLQGGMAIQRGALEDGVALLTTGLAQYRAMGNQLLAPYFLSLLADGYRRQGKVTEALRAVSDALILTATNLDVFWEAELHRQKGELLLNAERGIQNDARKTTKKERASFPHHHSSLVAHRAAQAEACFRQAIEIAREQEAKLLELRAVMSLARLWQQQRKKQEACQMLAEVYNWFTEGLDTKDLRAAKALLAELA
jgi:predicted ATPase